MEIDIGIEKTKVEVEVAALKDKIGSSVKSMEMEVDDTTTNNIGVLSEPEANNKENDMKSQSSHQNGVDSSSLNPAKVSSSSAAKSLSVDSNKSEIENDFIFESPNNIGTENVKNDNENELQLGEAFKIVQNSETGSSYLIANRDLAPGSIIIEEFAAFHSPHYYRRGATVQFTLDQLCVTCGKVLNRKYNIFPCNICMWPLCSPECAENPIHLDNECSFLTASNNLFKRGPRDDENTPSLFYTNLIGVLRGNNLKKTNPTLFNQLQSVDQANPQGSLPKQQRLQNQQSVDFQNFLSQLKANGLSQTHNATSSNNTDDQMETETDDTNVENHEYETIFNLLRRNQFSIGQDNFEVHSKSTSLIFPDASFLKHSCLPNCTWSIGSFHKIKDFKIRVRTAVSIKKGESLTISKVILPEQHYQGTAFRKSVLLGRDISCDCERCRDPSECGLYTSGLVCPRCKEVDSSSSAGPSTNSKSQSSSIKPISGYLVPTKIEIDGVSTFKWKCNNNNSRNNYCEFTMDAEQVSQILEKADQEIKSVVETLVKEDKEMICIFWDRYQYVDELATRLENLADSLGLHRSHYKFFLKIRETVLMPSAGFEFEEILCVIPELLEKRMERLKFFLGVEDVVGPGLSMGRAHLLVSLMTVVYAFLLSPSWIRKKKNDGGPEGRKWLDTMYHLFQQTSEQSLEYFNKEFYVVPDSGLIKKFDNHVLAKNIPVAIRTVNEIKASVFDADK